MGSSSAPYVPPAQPDAYAVAAQQRAQNADIATTQTDLASQTATLQRLFGGGTGGMLQPAGAAAAGTLNGAPSLAFASLGALPLAISAGR